MPIEQRRELGLDHVAIVRIEQLYPLPEERLIAEFDKYSNLKEIVWTQEEPKPRGLALSSAAYVPYCGSAPTQSESDGACCVQQVPHQLLDRQNCMPVSSKT